VKPALLDVNVLTALLWPGHDHHDAAHRWFAKDARAPRVWATCPITQLGFVRVASNPAFSADALTPSQALAVLADNLRHPAHRYWGAGPPVPAALARAAAHLQGYRQVTDAYLVALARQQRGVVATFDKGLGDLSRRDGAGLVELVPLR
jgi:uncharacterized protein